MTDAYYYGKKAEEARKKRGSSNIAAIGKGDPRFNPAMRTRHGAAPDPGRVPLANKGNRSPVQPGNAMQGRWKGGSREQGGLIKKRQVRRDKSGKIIQRREQLFRRDPFGGAPAIEGTRGVQNLLEDMKSGPDPNKVVSSGSKIRAQQQAQEERDLMDARRQAGVPDPSGKPRVQPAGTPELQEKQMTRLSDRFQHAWKMDDIGRAKDILRDFKDAGFTVDDMTPGMEYLSNQLDQLSGGQTPIETRLAGKAAEAAETEQQSDVRFAQGEAAAARTATSFAQAQADRPGELAQAATAEARATTKFEQAQEDRVAKTAAAEQKAQADIVQAKAARVAKKVAAADTALGRLKGKALEKQMNKMHDSHSTQELMLAPNYQAMLAMRNAGEDISALPVTPVRRERYATLAKGLLHGGEYYTTDTDGNAVKKYAKATAAPLDWSDEGSLDASIRDLKGKEREYFIMLGDKKLKGKSKYIGLNTAYTELWTAIRDDAKADGLSEGKAKKRADKMAQEIFLGDLADTPDLYRIFVNSKYKPKHVDTKKAEKTLADRQAAGRQADPNISSKMQTILDRLPGTNPQISLEDNRALMEHFHQVAASEGLSGIGPIDTRAKALLTEAMNLNKDQQVSRAFWKRWDQFAAESPFVGGGKGAAGAGGVNQQMEDDLNAILGIGGQ